MAFRPSYMATLQSGHDAAGKAVRRVLLGRGDTQHTPNFDLFYHPLLIDPEKQSVEVVRQKLETPKDLAVHDGAIYLLALLTVGFGGGTIRKWTISPGSINPR